MNSKFRNFLTSTLFVKDIKCLFCNDELNINSRYCVCDKCFAKLPFITGNICAYCGEPIKSLATYCMRCKKHIDRGFDRARAVFLYKNEISKAIKDLKYFGNKYLAEYLSRFLFDVYVKENFDDDIVIPTPISKKSLKARGFNQSELLCSSFAENGFEVNTNCIVKDKETENQAKLNFKDRQTNLIGSFKVIDKQKIKNKNVLLVDDIFTTGATVSEIAFTLKKAGAKRVDVITLCHELPDGVTN